MECLWLGRNDKKLKEILEKCLTPSRIFGIHILTKQTKKEIYTMFRTIILSIAAVLSFSTVANAYEVNYNEAYRVVHNETAEVLSDISFEPQIEWVNGHPYVSMVEFDTEDRKYMNLYPYNEIILEPINPENIVWKR